MQPRLLKETKDPETGETQILEPVLIKQVISEKTSEEIRMMMEYVVSDGTGRNSYVLGYSIGGKTGTSEDRSKHKQIYRIIYWSSTNGLPRSFNAGSFI